MQEKLQELLGQQFLHLHSLLSLRYILLTHHYCSIEKMGASLEHLSQRWHRVSSSWQKTVTLSPAINVCHMSFCSHSPMNHPPLQISSSLLYGRFVQRPPVALRRWPRCQHTDPPDSLTPTKDVQFRTLIATLYKHSLETLDRSIHRNVPKDSTYSNSLFSRHREVMPVSWLSLAALFHWPSDLSPDSLVSLEPIRTRCKVREPDSLISIKGL